MKHKLNILLAALLLTGCAGFEKNAGKTLASIAATVDAGMKGWAAYVVTGKATAGDEVKVKAGYQQYQMSMTLARDAYFASVQTGDTASYEAAFQSLVKNKDSLMTLLQSFGIAVANK